MLSLSLLLLFAAVDDAVGAAVDVVVSDVTPPPGSDATVGSVDTGDGLLLLLVLVLFFFLFSLRSLCLLSPPLLLLFGDDDEVVDVDVDAADIAADVPSRRCNARV